MHSPRPDELDHFKRRINLSEFAAAQGYVLDRQASSRNSAVMRSPVGDKVVIAINGATGHWIYFSVRDAADNGTIIDFLQHRRRCSLGEVRRALRPWLGESPQPFKRPSKSVYAQALTPSSKDLARVAAAYAGMRLLDGRHAYLETVRCIPASVLRDPRFAARIKVDNRENAVFPHYNAGGLCGFELKNRNFTGFSAGGEKGLWVSTTKSADTALVVVEAAIDALSYHALRRPAATRYISIGGTMNPEQPALIQAAIERLPSDGKLIIATDFDEAGDKLAEQIKSLAALKYPELAVIEERPALRGQDWNDVLKACCKRS